MVRQSSFCILWELSYGVNASNTGANNWSKSKNTAYVNHVDGIIAWSIALWKIAKWRHLVGQQRNTKNYTTSEKTSRKTWRHMKSFLIPWMNKLEKWIGTWMWSIMTVQKKEKRSLVILFKIYIIHFYRYEHE